MITEVLLHDTQKVTLKELTDLVYKWTLAYGEDAEVTVFSETEDCALIVKFKEEQEA